MCVLSSSLSRALTPGPCIGSVESYPLCHQEVPLLHFRIKGSDTQATVTNYIRISGGGTFVISCFLKLPKLDFRTSELGQIRSETNTTHTIDYLNLGKCRLASAMLSGMLFIIKRG